MESSLLNRLLPSTQKPDAGDGPVQSKRAKQTEATQCPTMSHRTKSNGFPVQPGQLLNESICDQQLWFVGKVSSSGEHTVLCAMLGRAPA